MTTKDFGSTVKEVSKWHTMPIGTSLYIDKETAVFQDLSLVAEMPLDASSYDMPVKIKGTFSTAVLDTDLKQDAVLFNWVSWTDPKSSDKTKPDIYSVGCEVTYDKKDGKNKVRVNNYKGKRSFGEKELKWDGLTVKDANSKIRTGKRETKIDYAEEFKKKDPLKTCWD